MKLWGNGHSHEEAGRIKASSNTTYHYWSKCWLPHPATMPGIPLQQRDRCMRGGRRRVSVATLFKIKPYISSLEKSLLHPHNGTLQLFQNNEGTLHLPTWKDLYNIICWELPSGPMKLPLLGAQVWSLVGELRSCMPHSMAKKKERETLLREKEKLVRNST